MSTPRRAAVLAVVASGLVLVAGPLAVADEDGSHHKDHLGAQCANVGNDASAVGVAAHSPGVLSGNVVQVPVSIPVNVCGNSIDVVGLLNGARELKIRQ
ncbi:chaplin [Streptomyces sp. NPDC003023]|uniref:chaplin n=1 Tax=Streptomyces sp. NPDC003023 TaxID=3364675 RepID=UPI0036CE0BC4